MLYMARTAHLQEDESIQCDGVAEADAEATPWALLALTSAAVDYPAWRLVGTYANETAALAARRRLSRRLGSVQSPRIQPEPEAHRTNTSP